MTTIKRNPESQILVAIDSHYVCLWQDTKGGWHWSRGRASGGPSWCGPYQSRAAAEEGSKAQGFRFPGYPG